MRSKILLITLVAALLVPAAASAAHAEGGRPRQAVRFATFNASLNRNNASELFPIALHKAELPRPAQFVFRRHT